MLRHPWLRKFLESLPRFLALVYLEHAVCRQPLSLKENLGVPHGVDKQVGGRGLPKMCVAMGEERIALHGLAMDGLPRTLSATQER